MRSVLSSAGASGSMRLPRVLKSSMAIRGGAFLQRLACAPGAMRTIAPSCRRSPSLILAEAHTHRRLSRLLAKTELRRCVQIGPGKLALAQLRPGRSGDHGGIVRGHGDPGEGHGKP